MNTKTNATVQELDAFVERYAKFVRDYKQYFDLYVELDVDVLTGYAKVLEYRRFLEKATKKQCVPIWHRQRGLDEWKQIVKDYNYIGIGGIVIKEIDLRKELSLLNKLVLYAHKFNTKVHGMGAFNVKLLERMLFDSIDTTQVATQSGYGRILTMNGFKRVNTGYKFNHNKVQELNRKRLWYIQKRLLKPQDYEWLSKVKDWKKEEVKAWLSEEGHQN